MSGIKEYNKSLAGIEMPDRIKRLPVSGTLFPVPWFVAWIDGIPDFRVIKPGAFSRAVRNRLCWICGQQMGGYMAAVIGPMCVVNRITSEPLSHRDCATFAAEACPFLTNPAMRRNMKDLPPDRIPPPGEHVTRNPEGAIVWVTRKYTVFPVDKGNLILLGEPTEVGWYRRGQPATRLDAAEMLGSGVKLLAAAADAEGEAAMRELLKRVEIAKQFLPDEVIGQ